MSCNIECKLTIRDYQGERISKTSLPVSENFELYQPAGVELTSRAYIYAMLGLGHSVAAIKKSFDCEIHGAIYDQTGVE